MSERFDPKAAVEEFEALTKDAGRIQRETLKTILQENGETEYLQRWGLNGRTDPDSFASLVPVITHGDIEPYIRRISDHGQNSSILTAKPITSISVTSGTTNGKRKYVPFNDKLAWTSLQVFKTALAFRHSHRQYPHEKGRRLMFLYGTKPSETKGGLSVATLTTNLILSEQLGIISTQTMQEPPCSPGEVMFSSDYHQSLYCHLLCGLIFRNQVQVISAIFAHTIVQAFRSFEQLWEELVADIRKGTLSSRITVPSVRSSMSKLLKPDAESANEIYKTCLELVDSDWYGLMQKLFPNTKYIHGCMTGSMLPYLLKLRHYAGGLPLVAGDYGSSESWVGANVNPGLPPESTTFAVLPNIGYFEFIPLRRDVEVESTLVGLTDVQVGEEYEIVITNFAGLYRYRLGDVVKVQGFHNSTPELQFVCRRNVLLSVNDDRTTEKDLQIAVEAAVKLIAEEKQVEVVDFTSCVDRTKVPGHYVIFWEISGEANDMILEACCNCLENSFVDVEYKASRRGDIGIGPLELRIVEKGTFQKLVDHLVGVGAASSQFKTPRCIVNDDSIVLHLLCSNVVKSYFSGNNCHYKL